MIIQSSINPTETHGVKSTHAFKICASRQAFEVLSSGLYGDKIRAVIREVLCNAVDAHVEAGNPNPVEVHLPNSLEPYFAVKDYGTGLNDEQITTLYTQYFLSTKSSSNDYTGCLGLGSKSPLAYVDIFTVISRFNGVKRTYNAFKNSEGTPDISLMDEVPTSEANGLEVIAAVDPDDFNEFRDKLQLVARRFKQKPIVTGSSTYSIRPIKYYTIDSRWGLRADPSGGKAMAIMGNVEYPIDLDDGSLTDAQERVLNAPVDMFFAIGELDVTASREKLSFDPRTIQNIKTRIDQILFSAQKRAEDEIINATTLWEARLKCKNLANDMWMSLGNLNKGYFWRDIELFPLLDLDVEKLFDLSVSKYHYKSKYGSTVKKLQKRPSAKFPITEKVCVVYYNSEIEVKNLYKKMQAFVPFNSEAIFLEGPAKEFEKFLEWSGFPASQVVHASSLPEIVRKKRTSSPYHSPEKLRCKLLTYNPNGNTSLRPVYGWNAEQVDPRQGGVYVVIERYLVRQLGELVSPYQAIGTNGIKALKDIGIDVDIPVYGIRPRDIAKVSSQGPWVELSEYVKSLLKPLISGENGKKLNRKLSLGDFQRTCPILPSKLFATAPENPNSLFGKFHQFYSEALAHELSTKEKDAWRLLKNVYDLPLKDQTLTKLFERVCKRYPLIKVFGSAYSCDRKTLSEQYATNVLEYINLVDKNS